MIYAIVFTARSKESGEWASRVSGTKSDFGEALRVCKAYRKRWITDAMVMLIDSYGNRVMYDNYSTPQPEPNVE